MGFFKVPLRNPHYTIETALILAYNHLKNGTF